MIPISDLDIIFISFDEPQADEMFDYLKERSPRPPLRVHGVTGFDAAHKAAANLATTDRFITVDGDNLIRHEFFNQIINPVDSFPNMAGVASEPEDVVYSFTARNTINALAYGNGGVKIWPRRLVLSVDTHENGTGNDFCHTYRYWQRNEIASDVTFRSAFHAFRAGYREAVKLSLIKDRKLDWKSTLREMYPPNFSRLIAWASIGQDAWFGDYAIMGARQGLSHMWLENLDPTLINDYDWLAERWKPFEYVADPNIYSATLADALRKKIGIVLPTFDKMASHWIKIFFTDGVNVERHGLMFPDMKAPI